MRERPRRPRRGVAAVLLTAGLVAGLLSACSSGPDQRTITLTFIRHGESESAAAGVINTEVPGPSLTAEGEGQAEQIAGFMGALRAFRQALRDAVVHLLGKQVRKHLLRGLLRNALPVVDQP